MPPPLDGTKTSKITPRTSFHKRISSLFCTKKLPSEPDAFTGDEEIDDTSPMRMISPRITEFEPSTPQPKRRTFSFRKQHSMSLMSAASSTTTGPLHAKDDGARNGDTANHVPVTDVPVMNSPCRSPLRDQMQSGMEYRIRSLSVSGSPASPTREAALTSHPIVVESDGEDKFLTPDSEMENEVTGCVGTK